MKKQENVICRPCKEEDNWEIQAPNGKVLPNHFNTKAECIKVGKKYAMEAGCECVVNDVNKSKKK